MSVLFCFLTARHQVVYTYLEECGKVVLCSEQTWCRLFKFMIFGPPKRFSNRWKVGFIQRAAMQNPPFFQLRSCWHEWVFTALDAACYKLSVLGTPVKNCIREQFPRTNSFVLRQTREKNRFGYIIRKAWFLHPSPFIIIPHNILHLMVHDSWTFFPISWSRVFVSIYKITSWVAFGNHSPQRFSPWQYKPFDGFIMSARNQNLHFNVTRETQSCRALPKTTNSETSKEPPQRSQHVTSSTRSSNYITTERGQATPQRKGTLVICEHQDCLRAKDMPQCQHYCVEHCCNHIPDHAGNIATRFARDEPKRFPNRRCYHVGCNAMRIRVCARYCRAHCCYPKHGNWRLGVTKQWKPEPGAASDDVQHQTRAGADWNFFSILVRSEYKD